MDPGNNRANLLRLFAVLFAVALPSATLVASPATRIALVSNEEGGVAADAASLAVSNLSHDAGLEMVERVQVGRLLSEQKLSSFGAVEASDAVTAGKLLAIDLFAVVESQPEGKEALGLVIYDARNGVRYWDATVPAGTGPAAEAVAAGVRSAVAKQRQLGKGLRTVGLLAVRNADLPRRADGLCESVGLLLERALPHSPDIAVLERKRLRFLNEERSFHGASVPDELLTSVTSLDLEIARSGVGGLKATAILTRGGDKNALKLTAEVGEKDAPQLATALLQKILTALKATPAESGADRLAEARRFDREASHRYAHDQFAQSVSAEEAASALDPASQDIRARLSLYLVRFATWLYCPREINSNRGSNDWEKFTVGAETLEILLGRASRGVEMSAELLDGGLRDEWGYLNTFDYPLERLCHRLHALRKSTPEFSSEVEAFLQLCRDRSERLVERSAAKAAGDPREFDHYTAVFQSQCAGIKAASIDTPQYAETMRRIAGRWLDVTKNWPPSFAKWNGGEAFNMLLAAIVNESRSARWPWSVDGSEYARRLEPLFAQMKEHARPSIRLYGLLGQIRAEALLGKISSEAAQARFAAKYRPLAETIITAPVPWDEKRTREEVYEAWRSAIAEVPGVNSKAFVAGEFAELGNFLLGCQELRSKLVESILEAQTPASRLDMADRMTAVLGSARLDDPASLGTIRSYINTARQNTIAAHPDLAAVQSDIPWAAARKLFDIAQFRSFSDLVRPIVIGNLIYAFSFEFKGESSALRLLRISLEGSAEAIGQIDLGLSPKALGAWQRKGFVTAASVEGDNLYVATNGAGIVIYPLSGGEARRLDTNAGLPSAEVHSLACLNGKLYAGVGEGYLISCDLEAGKCEVVASSRSRERRSPIEDGKPFRVPFMLSDPERGRVVFVIRDMLWQITPADGRLAQVLNLLDVQKDTAAPKLDGSTLIWSSPRRGDRALLSTPFRAIEINLRENSATVLHHPNQGVFQMWPPHLVVNETLWSADYFASLSLRDRCQQRFPPLPGTAGPYRPTQCLEVLNGGRQALLGDEHTLWLLDLKQEPGSANVR